MELLDENRSLLHAGKVLGRPDTAIQELNSGWTELNALLFDNYCEQLFFILVFFSFTCPTVVLTKPREKDGITKYMVYRRVSLIPTVSQYETDNLVQPIPLDLLELKSFTDAPTQRNSGLLRNLRTGENGGPNNSRAPELDPRAAYPFSIHHAGRSWSVTLYAETAQVRADWKQKLEEAKGLRQVVSDSNRVFEMETLSIDTFLLPLPNQVQPLQPATWHDMGNLTGKVTCSVPFSEYSLYLCLTLYT